MVLGYLVPAIALTLPGGRWLDRVSPRWALKFSVTGFVTSSILAGAAHGVGGLIAARVLEGSFGALLFALLPVLTTVAMRPESRGRAMAVVTTLGPLGAVSGPVVGGFLVQELHWAWLFYVNVPVGLAVTAIAMVQLPAGGRPQAADRSLVTEASASAGITCTAGSSGTPASVMASVGVCTLMVSRVRPGVELRFMR